MFLLLVSFVLFAALSLVMVVLGGRIPPEHLAVVRARYAASPETVWAIVSAPLDAASWRPDLHGVDRLPSPDGALKWREWSRRRSVDFEALPALAGQRFSARIAQDDLPFAGQWDYEVAAAGAGTALVITERGLIRPTIIRVLARYAFGYTRTLTSYHRALASRLGERVDIEIVQDGRSL